MQDKLPWTTNMNKNHGQNLNEAVSYELQSDIEISFYCQDGILNAKSLPFKLQSRLLNDIFKNIWLNGCESYSISLPDIKKSDVSHLVNLVNTGKSSFSTTKLGNVDNCAELVTDLIKFAKILEIEIKDYCFDLDDNAILSRVNDKTNDSNNIDNQASASSQLSREEYFEENQNNVKVEVKPEFDIIDLDSESEDGEILEINGGEKDCTVPKISLVPVQTLMHHENHQDQVSDDSTTTKKTILMEMRRRVKRTRLKLLKHNGTKYCCSICWKSFDPDHFFFYHVWLEHFIDEHHPGKDISKISPDDLVVCEICSQYTTIHEKDAHTLWAHNGKGNNPKLAGGLMVPCPDCGQTFRGFQPYVKHLIAHATGIPESESNKTGNNSIAVDSTDCLPLSSVMEKKRQKKRARQKKRKITKELLKAQQNQLSVPSSSDFLFRPDGSWASNVPYGYTGGAVSQPPRPNLSNLSLSKSILGPGPTRQLQVPSTPPPVLRPPLPERSQSADDPPPLPPGVQPMEIENNIERMTPPIEIPSLLSLPLPPLPTPGELFRRKQTSPTTGNSQPSLSKNSTQNKKNDGSTNLPIFGKSLSLLENKAKETVFPDPVSVTSRKCK